MRIVILTFGSRGDVQPYVALGLGLQRAGHDVRLLATRDFAPFVKQYGLDFVSAGDVMDAHQLLAEWGERFYSGGQNPFRVLLAFVRAFRGNLDRISDAMLEASREGDVLVASVSGAAGQMIAKKLGIPLVFAVLAPIGHPTNAFPAPLLPIRSSLGPLYNRFTHQLMDRVMYFLGRYVLNSWQRDRLGLASMPFFPSRERIPWLYGFSEHLIRRPADWPDHCHLTGHWFLDSPPGWQPPADLVAFLGAGPPPVYAGFGSMISRASAQTTRFVIDALERTGQRGIIATGWGGLEDVKVPDTVYKLREAPHGWLFPQMAAVVHHGGAGTTAAGLRAGVPAVVVPHFGDQFYWAWLVSHSGYGPAPIPRKKLNADRLAAAIQQAVEDQSMRARVHQLGEAIRSEDGVGNAVRAFDEIIARARSDEASSATATAA